MIQASAKLGEAVPSVHARAKVRIVRGEHEYSATFAWSRFDTKELALQAALNWRDLMLARLPAAGNGHGGFRATPSSRVRITEPIALSAC